MQNKNIETLSNEIEIRLVNLGSELAEFRGIKSELEKVIKQVSSQIIEMLDTLNIKSFEDEEIKISKQDVSRTVIDNNVAKVVIPKKYLSQIMRTTEFSKVLVKEKEEVVA